MTGNGTEAGSGAGERTVVAAIIREDGRILLTRRRPGAHHGGLWEFPGGKVEPGEKPEEALVREIREELGGAIEVGALRERVRTHGAGASVLTILFYECRWTGGEPLDLGVEEHRWVEPGGLAAYSLPPADRAVVERLAREGQAARRAP